MFEGYCVFFICERSQDKQVITLLEPVSSQIKHRWYIFRISVAFVIRPLPSLAIPPSLDMLPVGEQKENGTKIMRNGKYDIVGQRLYKGSRSSLSKHK
jgi:hypothetical protein